MESKKDIGKLFRDHLEQLDFAPSAQVWEQIESDLEKKKKKRRFFIWFFFAALVVGSWLGVLGYQFSGNNSSVDKNQNAVSAADADQNKNGNTTHAGSEEGETSGTDTNSADDKTSNNNSGSDSKTNADTTSDTNYNKKSYSKGKDQSSKNAKQKQKENKALASSSKKQVKKTYNDNVSGVKNKNGKKGKDSKNTSTNQQTGIAPTQQTSNATSNTPQQTQSNANGIANDIAKKPSVDSLIVATKDKKTDKKKRKETDSLPGKDSVAEVEKEKNYEIIVAPYYGINYSSFTGSFNAMSRNPILDDKAEMRNAYGVLVRWMFGNRLGIQVGAGKINGRYFSTIEKDGEDFINTQNVATERPIAELETIFANETKVKFTYESSSIEVPFEAYYVLRDKKFGLATSFGLSVLFSGKNTIFAESENIAKMQIGSLKTMASTGFTANAKLYLFYKITPSLQWDLYPSFQYQIFGNTDSAADYTGYFFSVRTGLSYKF